MVSGSSCQVKGEKGTFQDEESFLCLSLPSFTKYSARNIAIRGREGANDFGLEGQRRMKQV